MAVPVQKDVALCWESGAQSDAQSDSQATDLPTSPLYWSNTTQEEAEEEGPYAAAPLWGASSAEHFAAEAVQGFTCRVHTERLVQDLWEDEEQEPVLVSHEVPRVALGPPPGLEALAPVMAPPGLAPPPGLGREDHTSPAAAHFVAPPMSCKTQMHQSVHPIIQQRLLEMQQARLAQPATAAGSLAPRLAPPAGLPRQEPQREAFRSAVPAPAPCWQQQLPAEGKVHPRILLALQKMQQASAPTVHPLIQTALRRLELERSTP